MDKADFVAGEEITGLINLERYVQNKQQLLYNERVLESVRIEYSIGEMREDGKYPVCLTIYVKDTWNIIAIPRPQYSSNLGFDLTIKARDYNFLGTMSPLRFDIGFQRDIEGKNTITLMLDTDIPFRAFGFNWYLNFDHDFQYRAETPLPIFYKNVTGLSVDIPLYFTTPTIGFDVSFIFNEENDDYPKTFQEGLYISTRPFISWKIPTGVFLGEYEELIYTPGMSLIFNHEISKWPLSEDRKGPFINFFHSLDFGRINWMDNFQQGILVSTHNSFTYDLYKHGSDQQPLSSYFDIKGIGHFIVTNFFGISSQLKYRHWFNDYSKEAGDVMRGILDKDLHAEYMISLNLDFNIRALRIRPSEWRNSNFRLFNFDLHFIPMIDLAVYQYPGKQTSFDSDNFLISGGFEIVIFPDFFRSLYLRISVGWNFSEISTRTPMEIFIGTEFHY
jgi:hypothetical protein